MALTKYFDHSLTISTVIKSQNLLYIILLFLIPNCLTEQNILAMSCQIYLHIFSLFCFTFCLQKTNKQTKNNLIF